MIKESKKLFFKKLDLALEDDFLIELVNSGEYKKYSSVVALSYKKLDLQGFNLRTKTTALISLNGEEKDIFGKFGDSTRNAINRTYKDENFKFEFGDKNFEKAYKLYSKFEYMQKRTPFPANVFRDVKLFSAYYKDEIVSGIFVYESGHYLRIRSIFSKRLVTKDKKIYRIIANSSRRIMWEVCLWGKKNGYYSLDLASVNFKNPKTANITEFKMSFGGDIVTEYTYIYKSKLFSFFEKFVAVKLLILRITNIWKNILNKIL